MKAAEFYLKYLQTNIFEMVHTCILYLICIPETHHLSLTQLIQEPLAVQLSASFAGKTNKAFNVSVTHNLNVRIRTQLTLYSVLTCLLTGPQLVG